jgi:hypothetical protein
LFIRCHRRAFSFRRRRFVGTLLNASTLSGLRIEMLRSGAKAADAENSRHDLRRLF